MAKQYEALEYIRMLYNAGIRTYIHTDLPDELKNLELHKSAAKLGLIRWTGNRKKNKKGYIVVKEWQIPKNILTVSNTCKGLRYNARNNSTTL